MIEKIRGHRNLIGFDENGIPTATHPARVHHHEGGHHHHDSSDDDAFIHDYMAAVNAYKKTFPDRDEQIE